LLGGEACRLKMLDLERLTGVALRC
jgi:hypothetical protein